MKNLIFNSLRLKIILNMSVIIILFLGVFQSYKYFELKNQLQQEIQRQSDVIIQRLANELKGPLWDLNEDMLQVIMSSEAKNDNVHAIFVKGDSDIDLAVDKNDDVPDHYSEAFIIRSQEIFHNKTKVGEVKLFLTHEHIDKRLSDELSSAIVLTTFQIILIISLLWIMLNKTIISPIESLVKSTKLIAEGQYSNVKLKFSNDEIGLLSKSIEKMNENIASRERDIMLSAKQLEEVKEQLEYALNGSNDGLWDWKVGTDDVYFSSRLKEMLGYEDDEFDNSFKEWEKRVHPDDSAAMYAAVALSNSKPDVLYENIHRVQKKDGSFIWALSRGQTIFDKENKPVRMVGFYTDITELKQLQEELLEKEELMIAQSRHVAMGEMIGMIAHQWRQPITVIAMGANNMLVNVDLDQMNSEDFKHDANSILKQAEYLSKTIDDFRNFFRPNNEKDVINICDVVLEAIELIGKSITNSNIKLIFTDTMDETITTYSREVLQVVLNLLKNSKEVLEEKSVKDAYIKINVENIDDSIVVSVCDNGGGVDEDIKDRIFDPYFSTKGPKVGTGLGLYMSKTIVEKHLLGAISVVDTDVGVCFKVTLPKDLKDGK